MPTLPSIKHSPESRAAAFHTVPAANTKRAVVLRFLESRGKAGATDDEMQLGLGMNPSTQRPRRIELYEGGHIAKCTGTRTTRGGREAVVWISTSFVGCYPRTGYRLWPEQ
jgi:transcription initiation factor IIE alpha subunit